MRLVKIATGMAMVLSLTLPLDAASNGPKGPSVCKGSLAEGPQSRAEEPINFAQGDEGAESNDRESDERPEDEGAEDDQGRREAGEGRDQVGQENGNDRDVDDHDRSHRHDTTTGATTTTVTTVDFTQGTVAEKLAKNTNLRTKLETRLQAAGYDGHRVSGGVRLQEPGSVRGGHERRAKHRACPSNSSSSR